MYEAESFAPLGLSLRGSRPTACAVGCILAPLCGFPMPLAAFLRRFAAPLSASRISYIDGNQDPAQ